MRKLDAVTHDFEPPRDLMRTVPLAMNGNYGDPKVGFRFVVHFWKNLTAGWKRFKQEKVGAEVVLSISKVREILPGSSEHCLMTVQFIKGPLQEKLNMAHQKRVRCYGTTIHFVCLPT